ncbi:hypothetical protein EA552_13590 [Salmonella enterica]|nr:hypothetical protein [Salmonella enterica subsp. enterica serovar Minnesota]
MIILKSDKISFKFILSLQSFIGLSFITFLRRNKPTKEDVVYQPFILITTNDSGNFKYIIMKTTNVKNNFDKTFK